MDVQVTNNTSTEKEQKDTQSPLFEAPRMLVQQGVIAQSDWEMLTDDQKRQILSSHGINPEQYIASLERNQLDTTMSGILEPSGITTSEGLAQNAARPIEAMPQSVSPILKVERQILPTVEQNKVRQEFESIKNEVARNEEQTTVNKAILVKENNQRLTEEDKQRIASERALTQNTGIPKFFGYQPTTQLTSNAQNLSSTGPVDDGRTWIATLIKKILLSFKQA